MAVMKELIYSKIRPRRVGPRVYPKIHRNPRKNCSGDMVGVDLIDTLIVSDVHLGSNVSRANELYRLLKEFAVSDHQYRFRRLLLLGDMFDDMNFMRLRKYEWKLLGLIRKMTDEDSNARVVWIRGNHDLELIDLMDHLVGTNVHEEYLWSVAGKNFLAMHGDQFDKWVISYPLLVDIPLFFYELIQKIDGSKHKLSRFLKDKSKKWLRINEDVAKGIIAYATKQGYHVDAVFCGQTHIAEATPMGDSGQMYYNTGCWTGIDPPTYIIISIDGSVSLKKLD
jgi:UDP-2,3-diacylglucosamine pyrophosphatase LpxH